MSSEVETTRARFLTVPEVAERLAVSVPTVWRMISARELESVKIKGSRRVTEAAIDAYIERNTERGAA